MAGCEGAGMVGTQHSQFIVEDFGECGRGPGGIAGASCGRPRLPRSLEKLGRNFPTVEEATDVLASTIRRVVEALEPAIGWGARSTAILSDWT